MLSQFKLKYVFNIVLVLSFFGPGAFAAGVKPFEETKKETLEGLHKDMERTKKQIECTEKATNDEALNQCKNSARIDTAKGFIGDNLKKNPFKK